MKSSALVLFPALVLAVPSTALAGLDDFLAKPEPAYRWEKGETYAVGGCQAVEIHLVSQEWHGRVWEHRLVFLRPDNVEFPGFCTLLNTGGHGSRQDVELGAQVAKRSGAAFAILFDVPNQPLWGKSEDALIVHTWLEFVESAKKDGKGDESWPLHFPMAKAVVKSMDCIQAYAKESALPPVDGFLVCGASKRGWTTWLVGASGDPRVRAIAPMVIDTLNVPKQARHQLESYGKPSEQVRDYTLAGMLSLLDTKEGKRLLELEDPWNYRDRLKLPKLIINGTNDRYWTQDALNLYWDDLEGPKWVLYAPNSGHGLEDRTRVVSTAVAFARAVAKGERLPRLEWSYAPRQDGGVTLKLTSDCPLEGAHLFHATSKTRDFRDSVWSFEPMTGNGATFSAEVSPHADENLAVFGEAVFSDEGARFTLSTQIRIVPARKRWY
jgi:PhoPQ-activated pathogenicity-related protein